MLFGVEATVRARRWIPEHVWSRWRPWLNRGALAIIDQGLVSGSNFVLNVMLARWLPVSHYGGYALTLSMFTLITIVHQALLLEPMSVLGTARYGDRQREYLAVLFRINAGFSVAAGLLVAVLAVCARLVHAAGGLPENLGALALSIPGTLLFWLVRGGCYLELAPGPAALASLGYCVLALSGAWTLNLVGGISAASVLLWTGAAAWIGALILRFRFKGASIPDNRSPDLREVWREHWRYGRWALAATPVAWIPENISYAFASTRLGIAQAGVLRAMMNLVTPATQLATSLSRLLNPYLSDKARRFGSRGARTDVTKIQLLFAAIGMSYAAVLLLFHRQAFHLLYGNRFGESVDFAALMGVVAFFYLVLYGPMVGLRAILSPASVFVAYSGAAVVMLAVGFPLTSKYGLRGTIVSLCTANAAAWAIAAWRFYTITGQDDVAASRGGYPKVRVTPAVPPVATDS
jgi:O-antigen/teichoic acid export membrane protein